MNGFVGAVSGLIQEITNTNLGVSASESSSLHLGLLLEDEHFASGLANADLTAEDVPSMSVGSWIWYLRWRSVRAPAPAGAFLDALFEASSNPVLRRDIVESVLTSANNDDATMSPDQSPYDDWIRRQLLVPARQAGHAERVAELDDLRPDTREPREAQALEFASYLLEIGTEPALAVLRTVMRSSSPMRDSLIGLIYDQVSGIAADDETRVRWLQRLGARDSE
jgi:hypothetical protein